MIPSSISRILTLLGLTLAAVSVQAHPGHSLSDVSVAHLLTSPDHLAILAVGGVLMLAAAQLARQSASKRLLRHGGAVALIGAALLWSLRA
ncbi:MAG TPA: hypothetical protein VMB21_10520 [Candidatus Limnocylindria bacterium]|jgi:hypothetical protein|nr:hypothetical protein [Candidatus Limnocylindria bacterium]